MTKKVFLAVHTMALAAIFLGSSMATAASLEDARTAYIEGRYLEAASMGEALETSEGFALAADALAIHGYYIASEDEKQPLFDRAMADAREAVQRDAANPEAHLQSAHAMGRYAQTIGVLEALNAGFAEKIREAIDNALLLDPEMAPAHISLAAWHAEIVGSAGFMADFLYGATEEDALLHYETAFKLAPDQKAVNLEYAIGLLILDDEDYADRAREMLERAIELPGVDAYDGLVHDRAIEKLADLKNGGDN
jgi:tetratricopeptide (TPR) repeat protein